MAGWVVGGRGGTGGADIYRRRGLEFLFFVVETGSQTRVRSRRSGQRWKRCGYLAWPELFKWEWISRLGFEFYFIITTIGFSRPDTSIHPHDLRIPAQSSISPVRPVRPVPLSTATVLTVS